MSITVDRFISFEESETLRCALSAAGGWAKPGHVWVDYVENVYGGDEPEHLTALRDQILSDEIQDGGDWHQEVGVPMFSDGTCAHYSFRAWGDLLACIWNEHEMRAGREPRFGYMDFYMSSMGAAL